MSDTFNVGEHVRWNSEAGIIRGVVTKVHKSDTEFRGRMRRASREEPQYEVKSDKTGHVAMHKGSALSHLH